LVAAAALTLMLAIGGFYVWQQLGGRSEVLPDSPYTLRVQAGVPDSDAALVAAALTDADHYTNETLGRRVTGAVETRLARRAPCLPFDPFGSAPTAIAQSGSLCVDTDGPGWTEAREDPALAGSIIAHEHYHLLQAELGRLPRPDEHTHAWLVEGAATWVGWQTEIATGHATRDQVLTTMRRWGGWDDELPSLSDLEQGIGGDAAYALAYRAVDRLVSEAGPRALIAFCESIGTGSDTGWRAAFEQAFDVTTDDFYTDFYTDFELARRQ
jgi:hypothetical protein